MNMLTLEKMVNYDISSLIYQGQKSVLTVHSEILIFTKYIENTEFLPELVPLI